MHVLVVDDEVELAFTLVERLKIRGIEAEAVTSGVGALERIRDQRFDVVVLDVKMPGISGWDVIQKIKHERPDTQVILLTGHGSFEDAQKGMRAGAFDYLVKPVDIGDLVRMLRIAAET